jgi:hypothetical protein
MPVKKIDLCLGCGNCYILLNPLDAVLSVLLNSRAVERSVLPLTGSCEVSARALH